MENITIGKVAYKAHSRTKIIEPSLYEEHSSKLVQWKNTLAVLANCTSDYPKVLDIDNELRNAEYNWRNFINCEDEEMASYWEKVVDFLTEVQLDGKNTCVLLSEHDSCVVYENKERWFNAKTDEEACRKVLLEYKFDFCLLYIKDDKGNIIYKTKEAYSEKEVVNWDTKRVLNQPWTQDFIEYLLSIKAMNYYDGKRGTEASFVFSGTYDEFVNTQKEAIEVFNKNNKMVYVY